MAEKMNYADPKFATKARIDHAMAVAEQPDTNQVVTETTRSLATFRGARPGWRAELIAAVQRAAPPTLVVWGDSDRVLPPHHLDNAGRLLPFAETHLFAAVGHKPQLERPRSSPTACWRSSPGPRGPRTPRTGRPRRRHARGVLPAGE